MDKKTQSQIEIIRSIGQVVISILVVAGGFFFMYTKPDDSGLVSPMVGTVIAYYFLSANQEKAIRKTVKEIAGSDDTLVAMNTIRKGGAK